MQSTQYKGYTRDALHKAPNYAALYTLHIYTLHITHYTAPNYAVLYTHVLALDIAFKFERRVSTHVRKRV
ncbi:hypothetical protein EBZ38_14620 [bacterium]|nr:hypothetical protein [bacterium]NDD85492.1 hypothetical protein [bacterium]